MTKGDRAAITESDQDPPDCVTMARQPDRRPDLEVETLMYVPCKQSRMIMSTICAKSARSWYTLTQDHPKTDPCKSNSYCLF